LTSRFKIKRLDALILAIFYAIVGVFEIVVLVVSNFMPVAGALAVLSFIAAYGLLLVKKWSVWLVVALFFPQLVFGALALNGGIELYALLPETYILLLNIALAVFIVLSFISFVYVAAKRESFE